MAWYHAHPEVGSGHMMILLLRSIFSRVQNANLRREWVDKESEWRASGTK
jgi:hypothetical protein